MALPRYAPLTLLTCLLVAGCQEAPDFHHAVDNASYPLELTQSGQAPLTDGRYEEVVAPGG